jgi:dTDP-4-dehydrorhamnose reductase
MAMNSDIFKEIKIASRTKAKCDNIVKYINEKLPNCKAALSTAQVDADDVEQLKALMNDYKPEIVVNLALPYQDLTIMDACLLADATISTQPTTNQRTRHTSSTLGSGLIASVSSRQVSALSSVADSTQA